MEGDVYSINDILNDIDAGSAAGTLTNIETEMEHQESPAAMSTLWLEKAIVYLSIELVREAIKCCKRSLELDENNLLGYFVLGVCYLWRGNENTAMTTWKTGLTKSGVILTHIVISEIVQNCTVREYVNSLKFNVKALFEFHDYFNPDAINTPYGFDLVLKFIKSRNYQMAITYLNIILNSNPSNYDAIKYRGIAYCLSKQYIQAIKDLSSALSMKETDELLRYRANAYAMTKNYFLAIQDLTYVLQYNPTDYESLATRGTLQMWRGYFTAAMRDFESIPEQCYTSFIYLAYSEALYAIGDLSLAENILLRVEPTNNKRAFLEYLICQSRGDLTGALNAMLQITVSTQNARILQIAAKLFFDNGDLKSAIGAYRVALKFTTNPIEYILGQAVCYFCMMDFEKALETCNHFANLCSDPLLEPDFCQDDLSPLDTPLIRFLSRNDPQKITEYISRTIDRLKSVIYHINDSLESISPTPPFRSPNTLPEQIKFESKRLETLKNIAAEADKIGQNILVKTCDRFPAKRLIRALGLSALSLAAAIRREMTASSKCSWKDPFDTVLTILNLADPFVLPTWCDCLVISGQPFNAPKYEVHKGEWTNPRFCHYYNDVIKKFKTVHGFEINNSSDIINGFDQPEYIIEGSIPEHENIPRPSIYFIPKVFGFDIYLTPKSDTQSAWQTAVIFDENWKKLISGDNPYSAISKMIMMIWLTNQFTFYQNEIGHVFLHAYSIATSSSYLDPFIGSHRDAFAHQLFEPNYQDLIQDVTKALEACKVEPRVPSNAISFFDVECSVGDLLTILNL